MKSADVLIIGAGVIGLSLACELRRHGARVIVLEKHQPGREASWASAGMISHCEAGPHPLFRRLAKASAELWPSFAAAVQNESGVSVDLRSEGKVLFLAAREETPQLASELTPAQLRQIEPDLAYSGRAVFLPESHLDPRALMHALLEAALHLGVELDSGADVQTIELSGGRADTVVTSKARYNGRQIVNCAGAWAGSFSPVPVPVRPIKGQMLCLVTGAPLLRHVVHGNGVYVVPRSDGRLIVGSTVEDVGFDKRVDPDTIQRLRQAAAVLVPALGQARMHDTWAGLRPCTPDKLPAIGSTSVEAYFVATGHFRDGILLAPITARLVTQLLLRQQPEIDVEEFSPLRFAA